MADMRPTSGNGMAAPFGIVAIIVGGKLVPALGRHWHMAPLFVALLSGCGMALFYWGSSRALGIQPGRFGRWTPVFIGLACCALVAALHLIDSYERGSPL